MIITPSLSRSSYVLPFSQPSFTLGFDFEGIERALKESPVVHMQNLREVKKGTLYATHSIYLVTLANGLKGVLKMANDRAESYAEVAAYKAARFLGLSIVPPTVLRWDEDTFGSLQFYIESEFNFPDDHEGTREVFSLISPEIWSEAALFTFLMGQYDFHIGNILATYVQGSYHLALIDNETIARCQQVQWGEDPFVARISRRNKVLETASFDFEAYTMGSMLSCETLKVLEDFEIDPLKHSFLLDQEEFRYIIWDNRLWVQRGPDPIIRERLTFDFLSEAILRRLEAFDRKVLDEIWSEGCPSWSEKEREEYFERVLKRKEMLLDHIKKRKVVSDEVFSCDSPCYV